MSFDFSTPARPRVWPLRGRKWHFPARRKRCQVRCFITSVKNFYKERLVVGSQGDWTRLTVSFLRRSEGVTIVLRKHIYNINTWIVKRRSISNRSVIDGEPAPETTTRPGYIFSYEVRFIRIDVLLFPRVAFIARLKTAPRSALHREFESERDGRTERSRLRRKEV